MQNSLDVVIKSLDMKRERPNGAYKYRGVMEINKDKVVFEILVNQNIYVDDGRLEFISLIYRDTPGFNQIFKIRDIKIIKGIGSYKDTIISEFNRQYEEGCARLGLLSFLDNVPYPKIRPINKNLSVEHDDVIVEHILSKTRR